MSDERHGIFTLEDIPNTTGQNREQNALSWHYSGAESDGF